MTEAIKTPSRVLEEGTILADKYRISTLLGDGGFGITYGCENLTDHSFVAVKEYFPANLASRVYQNNKGYVIPVSGESSKAFEQGRNAFLTEAEYLNRYQFLSAVVPIFEILHDNGTVYMVMEYIDGVTLKQYISENGALEFDELLSLITPVMQALMTLHGDGLLHRDISPDNLMLGTDNQLHLLDFGAARFENTYDQKSMTILLKTGYTPIEQYESNSKQGAWTDIYALSATMYFCLTGITPPGSIERLTKDSLPSLAAHAKISSWRAKAIEKGMAVSGPERFRNMESFYDALLHSPIERKKQQELYTMRTIATEKTTLPQDGFRIPKPNRKIAGSIAVCTAIILTGIIFYWILPAMASKQKATCLFTDNILDNSVEQLIETLQASLDYNAWKNQKLTTSENNSDRATNTTSEELTSEEPTPKQNNSTTTPNEKKTEKYRVDSIEDEYDSIILD